MPGLVEIVAGEQQAIDAQAVLRPLLDLVEIASVRVERILGFFRGPIVVQGPERLKRKAPRTRNGARTSLVQ